MDDENSQETNNEKSLGSHDTAAADDANKKSSNGAAKDSNGSKNGSSTDTNSGTTQPRKKCKLDLASLPSRQYLDQTVVPVLLRGITSLTKERPDDPVDFLAKYLLSNKDTLSDAVSNAAS